MDLAHIGIAVSIIVGLIAIFTFLYQKVVKPAKDYFDKAAERNEKIDFIILQLNQNGGKSIKDQLNRIEEQALGNNQAIADVATMLSIGQWRSDDKGQCVYASTELCNIMQRSEGEILQSNWASWIHPEDRKRIFEAWDYSVNKKTIFDEKYRFVKDGHKILVHGVARHILRNGVSIGLNGMLKKI